MTSFLLSPCFHLSTLHHTRKGSTLTSCELPACDTARISFFLSPSVADPSTPAPPPSNTDGPALPRVRRDDFAVRAEVR